MPMTQANGRRRCSGRREAAIAASIGDVKPDDDLRHAVCPVAGRAVPIERGLSETVATP
jgi:hypothetical protein